MTTPIDRGEDLAFVLQCATNFLPLTCNYIIFLCPSQCNVSQLASIFDALWNGNNPTRDMVGFFHEVKIIHTTRGPNK